MSRYFLHRETGTLAVLRSSSPEAPAGITGVMEEIDAAQYRSLKRAQDRERLRREREERKRGGEE